jgi:trehalose/maltose transport system permease protein
VTRALRRLPLALAVFAIMAVALFPFYNAVVTSLRSGTELYSTALLPAHPTLQNYLAMFQRQQFGRNIVNSLLVASTVVCIALALGLTAAYALARVHFRGRGLLLAVILSVSMFPQVAVLSGMYELMQAMGLLGTLPSLVVSYMIFTLPFTVWVLTSFMRQLPKELEEAAYVDGASPLGVVVRVFLPLMVPAMVTTGLLSFIAAWNEFLFALTFTVFAESTRTVPVAIAMISGATEFELPWGNVMAASVVVTVPLIVLVMIFQRRIVAGLTAGAVKG